MQTIEVVQQAGADKMLHVTIPVAEANQTYRMVIVVVPESSQTPSAWPPDFFEKTAGRWQGDFVCEDEGNYEQREPL